MDDLAGTLCTLFNSFAASTPVEMADGSQKPISDVQVGDQVLATDPTTGKSADKPVTDVIIGQGLKRLVDVRVVDSDGDRSTVSATSNHPFWVDGLSAWIDAGDLKAGEHLHTGDGRTATVVGLHAHDETTSVYNLTVDGTHTYYVSPGGITLLVHNGASNKDCGSANVPSGRIYELRLMKELGAADGFKAGKRQFDGKYTANGKEIWYEAKSGNYWQLALSDPKVLAKFQGNAGEELKIANSNGADFMIYSENEIPQEIRNWLDKKGIKYEVR
jgi:hypothetical protein